MPGLSGEALAGSGINKRRDRHSQFQNVEAVVTSTACDASLVGPSKLAASPTTSQAHHSLIVCAIPAALSFSRSFNAVKSMILRHSMGCQASLGE